MRASRFVLVCLLFGTARLAQAGSYTTPSISWRDNYCGPDICGSTTASSSSNGVICGASGIADKVFTDKTPPGTIVTDVQVKIFGTGDKTSTATVSINNTVIEAARVLANGTGATCDTTTFSLSNAVGIPNWKYQADNTVHIDITSGANGYYYVVSGTVTATYPAPPSADLSVAPNPVAFGNQRVGITSAAKTVTITSTGLLPLTVTAISAPTDANAGDFVLGNLPVMPFTLATNQTATFNATFTPAGPGTRLATFTITSNAPTSPTTVALSGTGIQPAIAVASSPVAFGDQRVGISSAAKTVTITNTGDDSLSISDLSLGGANAGDFSIGGNPAPVTLVAHGTATFTVLFTPTAAGARAASVTIKSNAPTSPTVVPLTGNGLQQAITVAPLVIDFGAVRPSATAGPKTVTITNSGTAPLTVQAITLGGTNPGDFALTTLPSLPATLAPKDSQTFAATFTPTVIGARSATVTITSDAPDSPAIVQLQGNGASPVVSVVPTALDFGPVQIGTHPNKSVTLSNQGPGSITVTALAMAGSKNFGLVASPTLPLPVAQGAALSLVVSYAPTAIAADSGSLVITTDSTPDIVVPLTGSGVTGKLVVTPLSIDFGSVLLGATSEAKDVTVSNTGSGPLRIMTGEMVGDGKAAFAVQNAPPLPAVMNAGDSQVLHLTFSPTVMDAQSASLRLTTDLPDGASAEVKLTGTGRQTIGGGGCSCRSGDGATWVVVVLAMVLWVRRRRA